MSPVRCDILLPLHPPLWEALGWIALSQGLHGVGRVGQPAHAAMAGQSRLSHGASPQAEQTNVLQGLWGKMRRRRQGASPRQGLLGSYLCSHTHPAYGQMGAGVLCAADCLTDSTGMGGCGLTALGAVT